MYRRYLYIAQTYIAQLAQILGACFGPQIIILFCKRKNITETKRYVQTKSADLDLLKGFLDDLATFMVWKGVEVGFESLKLRLELG